MAVTRSQTAKRRHLKPVGGVTHSQTVKHRQFKSAGHSLVAKSTYHSMGKKTSGQKMSSGTDTTTGASLRAVKVTCYGTYKGSRASQGLGGYVLIMVPVKKPFPFLKLPAELRNRIYEDALLFRAPRALHDIVRDHARDSGDDPSQTVLCQPALTRVCKQIREESLSVYYGLNEFSAELLACNPRHNASAWLARIGNANCLMVRHLIIHVSASVECISVDSCRFRHLPTLLHSQGIRLEHPFKIMDYNWTGDCFVSQYNALHPRASLAASGWNVKNRSTPPYQSSYDVPSPTPETASPAYIAMTSTPPVSVLQWNAILRIASVPAMVRSRKPLTLASATLQQDHQQDYSDGGYGRDDEEEG